MLDKLLLTMHSCDTSIAGQLATPALQSDIDVDTSTPGLTLAMSHLWTVDTSTLKLG